MTSEETTTPVVLLRANEKELPPHDHRLWGAAALFVLLTVVATYPIAKAPASYAFFGHSDAQLNMWIMAWDAHALRERTPRFFNANIFYPNRDTLAYSETLLGYLPIFGPVLWLHGSPALAFNLVLLFSFAASGFCMYLLARHLTDREWPALVAGIVYAFVPYRFVHIPQIQLEAMEWFPLAFLCLHLFVEGGLLRHALWLGAATLAGALCCVYYGLFLTVGLGIAVVVLLVADRRARDARKLFTIGAVACVAAILVAPLALEYLRVHRRTGFERSIVEIRARSANFDSYLASGAPLHRAARDLRLPPPRDYLFPGFAALFLAGVGVLASSKRRDVALYLAVGIFGVAASTGPDGWLGAVSYRPLAAAVPLLHGIRQISRFGVLALFGVSVLAALGCAAMESWWLRRRAAWQIAVAALVFLELCPAPLGVDRPGGDPLMRVPETPDEYRWLATQHGRFAVLELPLPHVGQVWRNASYVYWSTAHWHPLINGYSGFVAPDYASFRRALDGFPDEASRQELLARDVRYVLVHWDRFTATDHRINVARLSSTDWLRVITRFRDVEVYEIPRADDTPAEE